MLPTINYVFDRKKNRKVELCVYFSGKRRYLSTGVTVPANATFRNGIITGCSTAPALNKTLHTAMNLLQEQLQEQIATDSFELKEFSLSVTFNKDNFIEWVEQKAGETKLKPKTKEIIGFALKKISSYGIVKFSDVTPQAMNKAISAMANDGVNPLTIHTYIGVLRRFINIAVRDRLIASNPMDKVVMPKCKRRTVNYLTKEELAIVENAELKGHQRMACDMFLFSCYTGLAYSDLVKIKKDDIIMIDGKPHIIDNRKKTGGKYKLRMLPKAMEILERYNYNLNLMLNQNANKCLEKIEKKIGLKKHISMHVGRHTFATLALSSGVRIETVSRMLAHADIKTTQIYAKVLQEDVDKGFDILEGKI